MQGFTSAQAIPNPAFGTRLHTQLNRGQSGRLALTGNRHQTNG
jgi:hypothetical protein